MQFTLISLRKRENRTSRGNAPGAVATKALDGAELYLELVPKNQVVTHEEVDEALAHFQQVIANGAAAFEVVPAGVTVSEDQSDAITGLQEENDTLSGKLDTVTKELETSQEANETMAKTIATLTDQLEAANSQLSEATETIEKKNAEIQSLINEGDVTEEPAEVAEVAEEEAQPTKAKKNGTSTKKGTGRAKGKNSTTSKSTRRGGAAQGKA